MKYLTSIDLTRQELQNAVIQNLGVVPSNPVEGLIYYNTVEHRLFVYNGGTWVGADAVGATMSASDILTAIKTVDGAGSGLDADLLDGQSAAAFTAANGAITPGTATKVTYDGKGLVTGGVAATTADIADSLNKRYVTDAQQAIVNATTGTNSGDQSKGTPAVTLGTTNGAGAATTFLATDAAIAVFDVTVPTTQAFGDSAAVGSAAAAARRDHKHAMPVAPTISDTTISISDVTTSDASTSKHGFAPKAIAPAATVLNVLGIANGETAFANKPILGATTPSAETYGAAAAAGSSMSAARIDHVHAMPTAPVIPVTGTPAVTLGTTNSTGAAATHLATDATIAVFDATVPTTQGFGDAAAVGSAAFAARRDHKHAMPAAPTLGGLGGVATSRTVNGHALSADVSVTQGDVGLGAVTNNAQVKKAASSTDGSIPKWSGTTGDVIIDGYTVETSLVGGSSAIPRADAVKNYVDGFLATNDAMIYKGTLGSGGTITAIPTTYNAGWSYKVITAATYAGIVSEVGDLIVAVVDRAGSGNLNSDWTVLQTNVDGAVTGPASAVASRFASFSGTSGKLIADSGFSSASFVPVSHLTGHISKYTTTCGTSTTWTVTHGLGTQDVTCTIKEVSSQAIVYADIVMTSTSALTVTFAVAPTAGQYSITVIG